MLLKHFYSVANCTEMFTKQLVFTNMSLNMSITRTSKRKNKNEQNPWITVMCGA